VWLGDLLLLGLLLPGCATVAARTMSLPAVWLKDCACIRMLLCILAAAH
jgi:hypothetical protein